LKLKKDESMPVELFEAVIAAVFVVAAVCSFILIVLIKLMMRTRMQTDIKILNRLSEGGFISIFGGKILYSGGME